VAGNRYGELYSEWSIAAPRLDNSKVVWPDLFYFTTNHFHTLNTEDRLDTPSRVGLPFNGDHGSAATADVLLVAGGPGIRPGVYGAGAGLVDIAPTLYHLFGVAAPANVNGRVLDEILDR
jgi:predicted AlkP superfamily pyrophosphatase or phosphodiesterase